MAVRAHRRFSLTCPLLARPEWSFASVRDPLRVLDAEFGLRRKNAAYG